MTCATLFLQAFIYRIKQLFYVSKEADRLPHIRVKNYTSQTFAILGLFDYFGKIYRKYSLTLNRCAHTKKPASVANRVGTYKTLWSAHRVRVSSNKNSMENWQFWPSPQAIFLLTAQHALWEAL